MKSKNDNIMQFNTQSNTRGGKIIVDSSDSEDNEEQSENENTKKSVFPDWNSNTNMKRQVIKFNELENQTKEEKENTKKIKEAHRSPEVDNQSNIKRVSSTSSIHYPSYNTEFYMVDEDDDYYNNNYSNRRHPYDYPSSHRNRPARRNPYYDNTEDSNNDSGNYNYRNDNDSYQPAKFVLGQKQQVSQPPPQMHDQQPQYQQQPQQQFYRTQQPPRSQPSLQSHYSRDIPTMKFFGSKAQPAPSPSPTPTTAPPPKQQEFRPVVKQHEFRPQQRQQQDFRPNQQQKTINFNFNQQKQPQPNITKCHPVNE